MPDPRDPLAVLLLGPTGSGKTALSLALAERFNGEIISCDSVAVYRGMDLLRKVENWAAPFVLVMAAILVGWAIWRAHGVGPVLNKPPTRAIRSTAD